MTRSRAMSRKAISVRPARFGSAAATLVLLAAVALGGCSAGLADEAGPGQDSAGESNVVPSAEGSSGEGSQTASSRAPDSESNGNSDPVIDTGTEAEPAPPTDAPSGGSDGAPEAVDLNEFFGSGGCMESAGMLMGWGMALMGPLTEGTELLQADVDALFSASTDLPAEVQPHVAVLRDALNAAAGKSQAEFVEVVGSPKVTEAMEGLTAYSDAACATE